MTSSTRLDARKTQADRRAEARRRLMVSARSIFEETDYHAVRISHITERAGVSYGLFYHYFDSKEAIFREVATSAYEETMNAGGRDENDQEVIVPSVGIEDGLRVFFERYRQDSALIRAIDAVSRFDPEVEATRAAIRRNRKRGVEEIFDRMQRAGRVDPGLDAEVSAVAVADMVWQFADSWLVRGDIECSFDHGVAQISRLMRNALQVNDPQASQSKASGKKPDGMTNSSTGTTATKPKAPRRPRSGAAHPATSAGPRPSSRQDRASGAS